MPKLIINDPFKPENYLNNLYQKNDLVDKIFVKF
jgi:hypothetical protein